MAMRYFTVIILSILISFNLGLLIAVIIEKSEIKSHASYADKYISKNKQIAATFHEVIYGGTYTYIVKEIDTGVYQYEYIFIKITDNLDPISLPLKDYTTDYNASKIFKKVYNSIIDSLQYFTQINNDYLYFIMDVSRQPGVSAVMESLNRTGLAPYNSD